MTNELAVQEQSFLAPKELIEHATIAANELFRIVDEQKLYVNIQKKEGVRPFLMAEAWQTIVALDNASLVTEWCEPVLDSQGETIAYRAKVNVIKDGEVKASGIMPCGMDEFPTRGQQGYAKHRAAMSSAQTWAGAKAARGKYAWVAVLAGYEPTPENEMARPGVEGDEPASNTRRNDTGDVDAAKFCPIHSVEWFQSPKMLERNIPLSHPVEGQRNWCCRDDNRNGDGVLTQLLKRMKGLVQNMDEVDRTALATEWKTMTPAQMLETVERLEASPVGQVIIDQEPDMMPDDLSDMGDEHPA